MLDCKILTSETEIEAIAADWRALHARAGSSPTTDYDRFMAWWFSLGKTPASHLHVVAGYQNGKLAAVLPLVVERRGKIMRLLREPDGMMFESDVLTEDPRLTAPLWQAARQSPHYDFAKIKGVYPQTASFEALKSWARQTDVIESFMLNLEWPSSKEWLASLSGNTRGNFKRCSRRLEEKGKLQYEVYKTGPLPMEIVNDMVKHKAAWCAENDKHGQFGNPAIAGYFQKLAEVAAAQGSLFLAWLRCGDDVIAYHFGLFHRGILHAYFWTYDAAWSQYSPGNVIMMNTISWALDNGLKGIDFIYTTDSNSEKYFKRKYANKVGACYEFCFSHSPYGRLIERAVVALKAVKKMIKPRATKAEESA